MSFKIGDAVEILYYEEGEEDAPSSYIGCSGVIFSTTQTESGDSRNIGVNFVAGGYSDTFDCWDFSTEQIKLVQTN